jgi:hypothetical protein
MTIAAFALSATMAQADHAQPPTQPPGDTAVPTDENNPGPVFEAWDSSAEFHHPIPPFDHNDPTPPNTTPPDKPDPLVIPMRMYKGCALDGQCAYVDQVGNNNAANIDQSAAPGGTVADVVQIGNNNAASIEQRAGAASHYGVITQNGNNNGGAIRQYSDIVDGASYADIQQGGDGTNGGGLTKANNNWASIDQGIGAGGQNVASYGNKALIRQEGVTHGHAIGNQAAIIQRGDSMRSLIEQDGDFNDASILQTGNNGGANGSEFESNEARITQVGLDNLAAIEQDGQFQRASIDQVGNNNLASIEQDGSTTDNGTVATGNTALIDQEGDFNTSSIMQTGDGNMASNTQDGDANWSSIWQLGNDNMARVDQTGDLNYSAITQDGNLNIASVVQNGFDWSDIQQVGNGNIAAVAQ